MNNFFSKDMIIPALALMVSGFIINSIKSLPIQLFNFITKHTSTTIEIPDTDASFQYVKNYLSYQKFIGGLRYLNVSSNPDSFLMSPAPGKHYFFYRGRLAWVNRHRKELDNADSKSFYENISIRIFSRNPKYQTDFLESARDKFYEGAEDSIEIFSSRWGYWMPPKRQSSRKLASVILDDNIAENLYKDINNFISNKDLYLQRGIPHRRGYLFHGVPGSGKSSLIRALATELNKPIAIMPLSDPEVTDAILINLISALPKGSFVLMEDIDCLFGNRDDKESKIKITYSGLLNAIDGIASPEGIIFIMTTNHRDKLDKALIRPGRIDREIEFKSATENQIIKLFYKFFPVANQLDLEQFLSTVPEGAAMAKVQELLMSFPFKEYYGGNIR
jgi:chaperone BCS1